MMMGRDDVTSVGDSPATTESTSPPATDPSQTTTSLPGTGVTTPPAELAIVVANGSTPQIKGLAAKTKEFLATRGYTTVEATNAAATSASAVYYVAGAESDAAAVATALGLPADPVTVQLLPTPSPVPAGTAKVVVVLAAEPPAVATSGVSTGASTSSTTPADGIPGASDLTSSTTVPVGN